MKKQETRKLATYCCSSSVSVAMSRAMPYEIHQGLSGFLRLCFMRVQKDVIFQRLTNKILILFHQPGFK